MKKTIEIDGKELEFEANAGTAVLFKRAFKKDLLAETQAMYKNPENAEGMDLVQQLAFIMNLQTSGKTSEILKKANEDNYFEWLCGLSTNAFWGDVAVEIINMWAGQITATSEAKN